MSTRLRKLIKLNYQLVLLIILLMPFHAFVTTWAGTSIGYREFWQAWKEVLIVFLAIGSLGVIWNDTRLRQKLMGRLVNQLIVFYAGLHLFLSLAFGYNFTVTVFGLRNNLAFLGLFIGAQVVGHHLKPAALEAKLSKILVGAGLVVAGFGLLQVTLLPADWLRHFGYGPETILPYMTINNEPGYYRILSTLGGPNQLGQYLILPSILLLYLAIKGQRWWWLIGFVGMEVVLFFSHSRSAWIGMAAALIVLLARQLNKKQLQLATIAACIVLAVGSIVLVNLYNTSRYFRFSVLHGSSEYANPLDSNTQRARAIKSSLSTIAEHPLGQGPGSAGPASFRGDRSGIISENYYLQLGIELGYLGLASFLLISLVMARYLWRLSPSSQLALPLLASFIGMAVVNLFQHGWADSTMALVWWGSSGLLIGSRK
jgi:hypothetical protein